MNRKDRRAEKKHGGPVPRGASAAASLLSEAVQHHQSGRLADAERLYRQILQADARNADALHLLGVVSHQAGRYDVAADLIAKAITQNGKVAAFHWSLGNALSAQLQWNEAAAAFRRAVALKPDYAEAHRNLGNALHTLGQLDGAVTAYRQALALKPDWLEAHNNLGNIFQVQGRLDEAVAAYRQVLSLKPDFAEVHNNLGTALREQGKVEEAIAAYRQALVLKPDLAEAHSNLLMTLHYVTGISNEALFQAALEFGKVFDKRTDRASITTAPPPDASERRLRIGYVSGDLCFHPVGYFLASVLSAHDKASFEIFCYSNSATNDAMTDRLRDASDRWTSITGLSDIDASALIKTDDIDILIDLSGHTARNRLPLFALRPAPVQAGWLGYFGTTGLAAMDYILMDATSLPPGEERWYSETVLRLPYARFCYDGPSVEVSAQPPCIDKGYVTFGSFNNIAKIGPGVVALWADVLQATPGSRLVLKWKSFADESCKKRLSDAFTGMGVETSRLEFRGASAHQDMLAEYSDIDIALDPFPFGGGLTSCEALWMGVPVIPLPGEMPASRQTLAFLQILGLNDLVTSSPADYIARATSLAADPQRLSELRQSLRASMAASPLCDGHLFTAGLEKAFLEMWQKRSSGIPKHGA
jgi:predicted O-linked N-acetylglucosamine transferase (SPINDLY family)